MNDSRKEAILSALSAFIRQRPGLEYGNYGSLSAYRSEMRQITKDRHQAETLLSAVSWRSISADDLLAAARSGRLSIVEKDGNVTIDYCTGQYFPTEYRRAVCAVLASALLEYTRNNAMPERTLHHNSETGETLYRYNGMRGGDWLRAHFSKEFGRTIANRWFN